MEVAATWRLGVHVTLPPPKECELSWAWYLMLASCPDFCPLWSLLLEQRHSPGRALLSRFPLLHSSRMVLRTCSNWGQAGAEGGLSTQWDHRKCRQRPFLSSIRGALAQGHVGKSPRKNFLGGSLPLKGNCPHTSQLRDWLLSFGPTGPLVPLAQQTIHPGCCGASPPPSSTRRFWDQGARWTLKGIEKRAGVSFCSEETAMSPAPNVDFYNTAVLYGLGLHWEWTLPHSFQTGIPWRVTLWGPSSLGQRSPHLLSWAPPSTPCPFACKCLCVFCVCVCVCVCARTHLCSIFWSLKHLNKEFLPWARLQLNRSGKKKK